MNGRGGRAWLLALVTPLLLVPGPAHAACPDDLQAVVYEVAEVATFRGEPSDWRGNRQATATLVGKAREGTPLCPSSIAVDGLCTLSVVASDLIRYSNGGGPVKGDFYVLGPGDNAADGDEAILIQGTLRGTIDLSPALTQTAPLGLLQNASLSGVGAKGTPVASQVFRADFTGTFRLPYQFPPDTGDYYYFCPPNVEQPVEANEMSLGVPTVRLEITFK